MTTQGPPKWSKSQCSQHNIAIFTSCPKSPKWCHIVPKGLQNESLGPPKCSKVEPSGPQRVPRGVQSAPKCAKRSPWEIPWNASWAQSGPSALQGSISEWILSDFEVHFSRILVRCFLRFCLVLAWLLLQRLTKRSAIAARQSPEIQNYISQCLSFCLLPAWTFNYTGEHCRAFRSLLIQVPESSGLSRS